MGDIYLAHHGVLGMKWGVRRYQNKDGSLTSAGRRKRKLIDDANEKKSASSTPKTKTVKELTDEELRTRISRLELEKRYSDLSRPSERSASERGKKFVMDVLETSGKNIATQFATYAMGRAINVIARDALNIKNGKAPLKNKDGKILIDDDGKEMFYDVFEDIVNPRKGQKDK